MQVILMNDVREFLKTKEKFVRVRAIKYLALLEDQGHMLRMPYSRNILPGIFELRVTGKNNLRLVYTFRDGAALVFYGFAKKTEEISLKDIRLISAIFESLQL